MFFTFLFVNGKLICLHIANVNRLVYICNKILYSWKKK